MDAEGDDDSNCTALMYNSTDYGYSVARSNILSLSWAFNIRGLTATVIDENSEPLVDHQIAVDINVDIGGKAEYIVTISSLEMVSAVGEIGSKSVVLCNYNVTPEGKFIAARLQNSDEDPKELFDKYEDEISALFQGMWDFFGKDELTFEY